MSRYLRLSSVRLGPGSDCRLTPDVVMHSDRIAPTWQPNTHTHAPTAGRTVSTRPQSDDESRQLSAVLSRSESLL